MDNEKTKKCQKCKMDKFLHEYHVHNKKTNTLAIKCKLCTKELNRIRYLEKKEHIDAKNKQWRDSHKEYRSIKDKEYRNQPEIIEHIKEYNKTKDKTAAQKWQNEHKNEKKEYDKIYRKEHDNEIKQRHIENKEQMTVARKIYYEKNKKKLLKNSKDRRKYTNDKFVLYMNSIKPILSRKLHSKISQKKYDISVSVDDLLKIWESQEEKCYISGVKMTTLSTSRSLKNVSIDQLIAGKGYHIDNVKLCCESLNMAKMQMSHDEFLIQLKMAGENLTKKFYENIIIKNEIPEDQLEYLLTLFNNKKLIKKLGKENIIELWKTQGGKCAITGNDMTCVNNDNIKYRCSTNISIDKINPNLGYINGNIQLTCLWANTGKLIYSTEDFRSLLTESYLNIKNKENNIN